MAFVARLATKVKVYLVIDFTISSNYEIEGISIRCTKSNTTPGACCLHCCYFTKYNKVGCNFVLRSNKVRYVIYISFSFQRLRYVYIYSYLFVYIYILNLRLFFVLKLHIS